MTSILTLDNNEILNKIESILLQGLYDLLGKKKKSFTLCKLGKGANSPFSFAIPEIENGFIVYYPPNSTHYTKGWDGQEKECRILKGIIYDAVCKKTYVEGETFLIKKDEECDPYTLNEMCLALVIKK